MEDLNLQKRQVNLILFLSVSLLVCFQAWGSSVIVNEANELIRKGKNYDALYKLENYAKTRPNELPVRGKLFELYLEHGLFTKAKTELDFLLKYDENIEHLLYQVKYLSSQNNYNQAEKVCLKILARDNRHIEAKLSLAKIHQARGFDSIAKRILEEVSLIDPKNKNFLIAYTDFFLSQNKLSESRKTLDAFRKIHPEDPEYFFLQARYFSQLKSYKKALNSLDRAIFYIPNSLRYGRLRKDILFKLKDYKTLIREESNSKRNNMSAESLFFLAYVHHLNASGMNWKLDDKSYYAVNFWPNIKASIEKKNNWELPRFFAEEIAIANYPGQDSNRKYLSEYHQSRAAYFLKTGQYDYAYPELIRLLELDPRNLKHRRLFADFHRAIENHSSYLEQLKLILELSDKKDFELETIIDKLTLKYKDKLSNKHQIEQFDRTFKRKEVLVILPIQADKKIIDSFEMIFEQMLRFRLRLVDNFSVKFSQSDNIEKEIRKNFSDYYLIMSPREYPKGVRLEASLHEAKNHALIDKSTMLFNGNDAYFEMFFQLKKFLDKNILLEGEIFDIRDRLIFVDVGTRNGIKQGQSFEILVGMDDETPIGTGKIDETDEYISTFKLDELRLYNRIKKGDRILIKNDPPKKP